ncbi:MAG: hypothetical protein E7541_04150 [Ruminococcaceae bacterium]|nr:hypothetical protein [Oscillospiraceae bacterium]
MKEWQQPVTTRRYLQPPQSQRLLTLWREGKVMLGEATAHPGPVIHEYATEHACGLWPVVGKEPASADVTRTESRICPDGTPVHTVINRYGDLAMTVEALGDTRRAATAYLKITLQNVGSLPLSERVGVYLRAGQEEALLPGAPDFYRHYDPDLSVWQALPATFRREGDVCRDGDYFVTFTGEVPFDYDEASGLLYADITLPAGADRTVYLTLGKGETVCRPYDEQKAETIAYYQKELGRLVPLPPALEAEHGSLIRHLTVQMLQCFTRTKGKELVICRQGGLQRHMWAFEALYVLEALDQLGDFDDYVEPAISLYFEEMQQEDGEVVPLGRYWAMASAMALYSFADHAIKVGNRYWCKHREAALRAFACIQNTRASTKEQVGVLVGLYPPRPSCDCELVFQSWTFTDTMNLIGLRRFADAATLLNDPLAAEIRAEYDAYRAVVRHCFDVAKQKSDPAEGIALSSFVPDYTGDETLFAFSPFIGTVTAALELDREDVEGLTRYMRSKGRIHEGLYWRMPDHHYSKDADGVMRVWYTTLEEYYWFDTFLRLGMTEECEAIIDSTLRYSMSPEYLMQERYHLRDPYFCPWSPNASANGRLVTMLLKLYR